MMFHEKTSKAARGKWKGILLHLGVPEICLTGKHVACPMCKGKDRFRFDNQDQRGTYICNVCGAGDGMKLAIEYTGRGFNEIASEIDGMLGNVKPDAPQRPAMSEEARAKALRSVWLETVPLTPQTLGHQYMVARGIDEIIYAKSLRFGAAITDGEGGIRPCIIALVSDHAGSPVTLHRTFLRADGKAKAEMPCPRKLMPGPLPDHCAVRLSDWAGGPLGIAEGIETAMAAGGRFGMPVWAAISAGMMAKWLPPDGCEEVAIFGDNDTSFAGQAAAYVLARNLKAKGIHVTVHIPKMPGTDWNDETKKPGGQNV